MPRPTKLLALTLLAVACCSLAGCTQHAERTRETRTGPIGPIVDDRVLYSGKLAPVAGSSVTLVVRQIVVSNATRLKLGGFDRRGSALLQGKAGGINLLVDSRPVLIDDGRSTAIATPATVLISTGNDTVMLEASQLID